jgi:hypothetical protein
MQSFNHQTEIKSIVKFVFLMLLLGSWPIVNAQLRVPSDVETTDIEAERLTANEGETKVITSAWGESPEKALENALRNAIEEAVGALITSETRMENDEIVKDELLSYSKGFIRTYKKLSEEKEDGEFKTTVAAIVTQKQIIDKLEARGVEVTYQTSGMFAKMQAWDRLKNSEFSLAQKIFWIDTEKPFPVSYDFSINVAEPVRSDDNFFISTTITAKPNANYLINLQNAKSMLNELAYEVREYAFLLDLSHATGPNSQSKMTYSVWVNVVKNIETSKSGKTKEKKDYRFMHVNFPQYRPRMLQGDYDLLNQHSREDIEFLGNLDYELFGMLSKRSYEKPLAQEDKNRLNDRSLYLDNVNLVYDVFEKNFTPYMFIIHEPKKITVYKFVNPYTIDAVARYFTFLIEGLHASTEIALAGKENIEVINPWFNQHLYRFNSRIRTTTPDIKAIYQGFILHVDPSRLVSIEEKHRFDADNFSRITNISVKPTNKGYRFFETKSDR